MENNDSIIHNGTEQKYTIDRTELIAMLWAWISKWNKNKTKTTINKGKIYNNWRFYWNARPLNIQKSLKHQLHIAHSNENKWNSFSRRLFRNSPIRMETRTWAHCNCTCCSGDKEDENEKCSIQWWTLQIKNQFDCVSENYNEHERAPSHPMHLAHTILLHFIIYHCHDLCCIVRKSTLFKNGKEQFLTRIAFCFFFMWIKKKEWILFHFHLFLPSFCFYLASARINIWNFKITCIKHSMLQVILCRLMWLMLANRNKSIFTKSSIWSEHVYEVSIIIHNSTYDWKKCLITST